jgi:hypothetical protein
MADVSRVGFRVVSLIVGATVGLAVDGSSEGKVVGLIVVPDVGLMGCIGEIICIDSPSTKHSVQHSQII